MTVIEVFADVCCPFTHVGLRRLVERRRSLAREDVALRIRAWPLELVNGAPLDPAMIAEEVDELRAQVAPDLFEAFDPAAFPPTSMPALQLAAAAYDASLATGEQVSLALRTALFEHGRDIAAPAVLAEVAREAGLTGPAASQERVRADWAAGRARGVVGSPHFFVGEDQDGFFCPTLDISRVDGHLRITMDEAGIEEFLRSCFA
jgi:predicted DsbA family dithiol-disulfide isomerase